MSTLESRSAETFIDHNRPHLAYFYDTFWFFSGGHWSELSLDVLNGEIAAHFEGNTQINRGAIGRLQRGLPHLLRGRLAASPESWNADPDVLPCANGLLNIPQHTLTPLEPSHRQARSLGAAYNPNPETASPDACPVWESFIQSTVPAEAEFLQEFAGLALTFDTRHEIAVWLYGPPGSGKSTFITGLELVLGERAGALNLATLARGRYRAADFFGRSLLISVEQPIADLAHDHVINALVSGEPIPVRAGSATAVTRSTAK